MKNPRNYVFLLGATTVWWAIVYLYGLNVLLIPVGSIVIGYLYAKVSKN